MNNDSLGVNQYLIDKGYLVKKAYFEKSRIEIGDEFYLCGYRVVYRVESGEFIICYLSNNNDNESHGNFLKLFNFINQLGRHSDDISMVRMLVVNNIASSTRQSILTRLIKILLMKGAIIKNIDGDDWLVFDVSGRE
ncbi:pathogenicity island 2 effector protein SseE [Yersinia enterocolitica]